MTPLTPTYLRELANAIASENAIIAPELALRLIAEVERLRARIEKAVELVEIQARDPGIWYSTERASEAYLQQQIRILHGALEGEDLWWLERKAMEPT